MLRRIEGVALWQLKLKVSIQGYDATHKRSSNSCSFYSSDRHDRNFAYEYMRYEVCILQKAYLRRRMVLRRWCTLVSPLVHKPNATSVRGRRARAATKQVLTPGAARRPAPMPREPLQTSRPSANAFAARARLGLSDSSALASSALLIFTGRLESQTALHNRSALRSRRREYQEPESKSHRSRTKNITYRHRAEMMTRAIRMPVDGAAVFKKCLQMVHDMNQEPIIEIKAQCPRTCRS